MDNLDTVAHSREEQFRKFKNSQIFNRQSPFIYNALEHSYQVYDFDFQDILKPCLEKAISKESSITDLILNNHNISRWDSETNEILISYYSKYPEFINIALLHKNQFIKFLNKIFKVQFSSLVGGGKIGLTKYFIDLYDPKTKEITKLCLPYSLEKNRFPIYLETIEPYTIIQRWWRKIKQNEDWFDSPDNPVTIKLREKYFKSLIS